MTRETKIGLLVGLAFIIVVGILLSDYNRMETPPAALASVGNDLRTGTATPRNGSGHDEVVAPPAPAVPTHPVLTREEVRGESRVSIGPGAAGPAVEHPALRPVAPPEAGAPVAGGQGTGPVDINEGPGPLERVAAQHGVELEPVAPAGNSRSTPPAVPAPPTVNGARQYVAIAGDTVSKLAGRFLGANTKTNREAILAVNPSLKQNPNNVIVGRTYIIPSAKAGVASASTPAPAHPVAVGPAATAGPQYWYTVKENDNLWKIAESQLGDGSAYAAIKELNRDVLKGKDDVRANMRLRLPAKPIASTND